MRWGLVVCLVVGCYRANPLECGVSCAGGAVCPGGLTCGADQLCHGGPSECTQSDASLVEPGPADAAVDAAVDAVRAPAPDATRDAAADASPDAALRFCELEHTSVVACYEFEHNADDLSGHQLNAATGGVDFQAGIAGVALSVNAASTVQIVETPLLDLAQFTVETWVNQRSSTNGSNVTVVNNVGQYGLFVNTVNQPVCAYVGTMLVPATATAALQVGHWTHLACTFDGVHLTLYVDGSVARQMDASGAVSTGGKDGTGIGSDAINTDPTHHFVGLLDDLRIFSVARAPTLLCADAGKTVCPPLN